MCVIQTIRFPRAVIHLFEENRFWEVPGACVEAQLCLSLAFLEGQYWNISAGYDVCDQETMNSQSGYKLLLWIGLNNLVLLQSSLHRIILGCAWSQKKSVLNIQPLSPHSHSKVISSIKISSHWLKPKMHASKKIIINLFLFKRLYWGKENEIKEGNIGAAR